MNLKKTMLIDIDNTIFDYYRLFRNFAIDSHGIIFPLEPENYSFWEGIVTKEAYLHLHKEFTIHLTNNFTNRDYQINPVVKTSLDTLSKEFNIHIVTARGTIYQPADGEAKIREQIYTLEWLEHNDVYYDNITFTNNKRAIDGDWYIDDNPNDLQASKIKSKICIVQPYNKSRITGGVYANNWVDIITHINFIEGEKWKTS